MERSSLTRFAWLSIVAAIVTIGLKAGAYYLTGSVGLLSDALESLVNLVAAMMALAMLIVAARPPDERHHFGHSKAEYFASGLEGALIFVAAVGIGMTAWDRLQHPRPLESLSLGLAISTVAAVINFGVARVLLQVGRRYGSITLEADAKHLLTDVWTSIGVLLGLGAVSITDWQPFDPIIAFLVALNILWAGVGLMKGSVAGLLDATLPDDENGQIDRILDGYRKNGVEFHDLRTRQAGAQRFMTVHVLVPGRLSVQAGHDLVDRIESEIRGVVGEITIVSHLEPMEDPASFVHGQPNQAPDLGRLSLARSGSATDAGHEDFSGEQKRKRKGNSDLPEFSRRRHKRKEDALRGRTAWRMRAGILLIVCGSALSMLRDDWSADVAMGSALVGLVVVLFSRNPED